MPYPYKTPGVYIQEKNAFPNSVVVVPTAIPAFLGYTEKAIFNQKDVSNQPIRITSMTDYISCFGAAPLTTFTIESSNAKPGFELKVKDTRFYLFHSMKLFFANGGGDCYIVSVGNYHSTPSAAHFFEAGTAGRDKGLQTLEKEQEPTLVVAPDLMLLSTNEAALVQQAILHHCGSIMRNRFAILDIPEGYLPRLSEDKKDIITRFRQQIGQQDLAFGAAYYPWVHSTITVKNEITFRHIEIKSIPVLTNLLKKDIQTQVDPKTIDDTKAQLLLKQINDLAQFNHDKEVDAEEHHQKEIQNIHQSLLRRFPIYEAIINQINEELNLLPPSAGMAGLYTMVDNNRGVFISPANISMAAVERPSVHISSKEQEDLNVPLDGKAVNAIRSFPGLGVLVWGARTLDGNSGEWKYINVRRTLIMIEQSVKNAAEAYIFEPNTSSTWSSLKAMITNFLNNLWKAGALAGAKPQDAYGVNIGLGSTMTPLDVLEGRLRISIHVAVVRPAEFIVITFEQQMQKP